LRFTLSLATCLAGAEVSPSSKPELRLNMASHLPVPADSPPDRQVRRVRPVAISHPDHFVNVARRRAAEEPNAVFADQFESLANFHAHFDTGATPGHDWYLCLIRAHISNLIRSRHAGKEIWEQTRGRVSAFVCGAGTGGTIAGVSNYLKSQKPAVKVFLADPPGSSLHNKVASALRACSRRYSTSRLCATLRCETAQVVRGVLFTSEESEGKRQKNPFDTITEGVGQNRLTANFARAQVDGSFKCSDQEAVDMVRSRASAACRSVFGDCKLAI